MILTDDSEFARLLSSCWRTERHAPAITVLNSELVESRRDGEAYDLVVLGPVGEGRLIRRFCRTLAPKRRRDFVRASGLSRNAAVAFALPATCCTYRCVRTGPRLCCWSPANHCGACSAGRQVKQAISRAAQNERDATLGRYMLEMKHSVNNALTSILGNAELLLLEPGQLSAQSLQQIKTMHNMTLRINEIMQRFSTLASEMREAENASQAETEEAAASLSSNANTSRRLA